MRKKPDALIVGAGHNGLVCAFYLARAGMKVRMLEGRGVVGGAAVTEEFHPGFRNSTASYTLGLLQPKIIADMDLHGHGLRIVDRPVANFLPLPDGRYLIVGGGLERTQAEIAKFSEADATALPGYYAMLDGVADVLRGLALQAPPNSGDGAASLLAMLRQGGALARLPIERQRDVVDLFTKSARALLDAWFESDPIKAAFGFDAIVGNYASPDTPGSAYVLLHHVFGEVNGRKGSWGHAIGGMGAVTQAMAKACTGQGVEIVTDAPVEHILVEQGRAVGVRLTDGSEQRAARIAANVGPRLLFEQMVASEALPQDFRRRIAGFHVGSGTVRMNVALRDLPRFTALPDAGEHLQAGIILAPSLDYMDRAFTDARATGMASAPIVEMLIPSIVDDSLAPPGHHVASLFCQQFAPILPDGRSWDDERDAAAELIVDTVERFAPGFRASILGRMVLTPLDLERTFGLIGGDIFHGAMSLDQLWAARPVLGNAAYRSPIPGLYMCGSGTHPGGGVTGAPGHNAAREILADRSLLRRLWRRAGG